MQKPPPKLEDWFIDGAIWVAAYFKVSTPSPTRSAPNRPPPPSGKPQTSPLWNWNNNRVVTAAAPVSRPVDQTRDAQCAQAMAAIKSLAERVSDFAARAKNAGFEPPDNPFAVVAQFNADRGASFDPINVSDQYAKDLVFNMKAYIDLLAAESQGGIDFSKQDPINKAQLAHVSLSFDGIGGSGNVAADIMSFLPSADQVKQNIAAEELAVLDFTRRIPYLLFTLDYQSGDKTGVIIGWKKIPDASGFVIKRHASFGQNDVQVNVDNARVKSDTQAYLDYAKLHALSYLEDLDESVVQLYFDDSIAQDEYYVYTLQAFQYRSDMKGKVFSGVSTPVSTNTWAFNQINDLILQMDPDMRQIIGWQDWKTPIYERKPSTISPWPAFAQVLMTDSAYDWIMAAINIRASVNRADDRATTRKYSYLNADYDFLVAQAYAGKLVIPNDVSEVIKGVENSISQFGVTQTILEIFQETGITYHFDGRDPRDNGPFDRAGSTSAQQSSLFHVIGSAIDPDTATIDLKAVAHNMAQLVKQPGTSLTLNTDIGTTNSARSSQQPSELFVPDPDKVTDQNADDKFQFISRLGNMDDSVVDLTTFDGISKLIRVIRIYSDFGPDKIKSDHTDPPAPPAPPPPPPPPPAPPTPPPTLPHTQQDDDASYGYERGDIAIHPGDRTGTSRVAKKETP